MNSVELPLCGLPRARQAADPTRIVWDVIVVGTGSGGATLGHALARAGKRVLFCEQGGDNLARPDALTGDDPEQRASDRGATLDARSADLLAKAGRLTDEVIDESGSRPRTFVPFLGGGSGGSSALYGMAMERFTAADFTPRAKHRAADGSSLEDAWPIGFDDFCAYDAAAEALYRVRGTTDPSRREAHAPRYMASPPPLTPAAAELFAFFAAKGLHPYRLPLACEFVAGCGCCPGVLCDRDCKNDSARVCLAPAVRDFGAVLLDDCQVVRIDANRTRATAVACRWRGADITLRGERIKRRRPARGSSSAMAAARPHSTHWRLAHRSSASAATWIKCEVLAD